MLDNLISLTNCYIKKCNDEFKSRKEIRTIWFKATEDLNEKYKAGKITKKNFIKQLDKLDDNYFNAIENINLHKCEINKCYSLVKKHLDYISDKNDIAKSTKKYTSEDYVKILKTNRKNFRKLP